MKDIREKLKKEIGNTTLVAVSKTKSEEDILKAYNLGIKDFGKKVKFLQKLCLY